MPSVSAQPPNAFLRGAALLVALVLLLAAWSAVRTGAVAWAAQDLDQDLSDWAKRTSDTGLPPTLSEWQASWAQLQAALARSPEDPHLLDLQGRLLALTVRTENGVTHRLPESIAPLERAVALRPTSPFAWASLAWTMYATGKTDGKFHAILEKIVETGPFEEGALMVTIDYGLATWDVAPETTKQAVLTALKNADRRDAVSIVAIAQRRGKLEKVCGLPNSGKLEACTQPKSES